MQSVLRKYTMTTALANCSAKFIFSLPKNKYGPPLLQQHNSEPNSNHMAHSKICVLLLLFLLISSSSGISESSKDAMQINSRKLLDADVVQLDYDYAGPNTKHDPRKGKGGASRSP